MKNRFYYTDNFSTNFIAAQNKSNYTQDSLNIKKPTISMKKIKKQRKCPLI